MPFETGSAEPTLLVVRHGQSAANAAFQHAEAAGTEATGLDDRDADVALSALGRTQAAALGRALRDRRVDQVCCSPYTRALQTWQHAAAHLPTGAESVPVVVDERLRDREMGQLELLTSHSIHRWFPHEAHRRVRVGEFYYRPPGGENLCDVALRLGGWLRDLNLSGTTLVVAHDAVVLMLRYLTESLTEQELLAIPAVDNASISSWITSAGALRLTGYNDTSHLTPDTTPNVG